MMRRLSPCAALWGRDESRLVSSRTSVDMWSSFPEPVIGSLGRRTARARIDMQTKKISSPLATPRLCSDSAPSGRVLGRHLTEDWISKTSLQARVGARG